MRNLEPEDQYEDESGHFIDDIEETPRGGRTSGKTPDFMKISALTRDMSQMHFTAQPAAEAEVEVEAPMEEANEPIVEVEVEAVVQEDEPTPADEE